MYTISRVACNQTFVKVLFTINMDEAAVIDGMFGRISIMPNIPFKMRDKVFLHLNHSIIQPRFNNHKITSG
jgi:hypothetical protein